MPHVKLEYSSNIVEKHSIKDLFVSIHQMLTKELPTKLSSCKSRATESQTYYLGDGKSPNAFVHLEVKIAKGRSRETIDKVAQHLLAMLKEFFWKSKTTLDLEITLEVIELQDTYYSPWVTK